MKYYLMPHPFKEDEDVIWGKVNFSNNGTDFGVEHSLWGQYCNSKKDIPVLQRTVISGKEISSDKLENLVNDYEISTSKNDLAEIAKRKMILYTRLGASFAVSGLIYFCTPDSVVEAVNKVSEILGNQSVEGLARAVIAAIPATFSVVKNIGIPLVGSLVGAGRKRSIIYKLKNAEKPLRGPNKIISLFDSSVKERLIEDMYELSEIIKKKSENKRIIENFEAYIEEIKKTEESYDVTAWIKKFDYLIKEAQDEQLPWGEVEQLKDMKKNILSHMKNNFIFAPLKLITPNLNDKDEEELIKQAKNLKSFMENPRSRKTRETIYEAYKKLKETESAEGSLTYLNLIVNRLERLSGDIARLDFGDTTNRNDMGDLRDFYYNLYVKFGISAEGLRRGKKFDVGKIK